MAIVIRQADISDSAAIARVHIASWQTAYRGILPDAHLDGLSGRIADRTARWEQGFRTPEAPGGLTFVAEDGDAGIVGFAGSGPVRGGRTDFAGELYAIYLLGERRGQGIGRRLFARAVGHVRDLGLSGMIVWVLERNPARGFYAAMGGTLVAGCHLEVTIAGVTLPEVAYGWSPLPAP
jgi:GNAT superfamily N-acetyltransferase